MLGSSIACALSLAFAPAGELEAASVEITLAGPAAHELATALPEFTDGLGAPTRYRLADALSLDTVIAPPTPPSPARARVWIEVAERTRARIIIVDQSYERILIRHVALESGLDVVARDEIGYIVESSLDALLSGGEIGVSRSVAARQLGIGERPPPKTRARPTVELSGGWGARAWGPVAPLHGPLLEVAVGAAGPRVGLGGAIEAQYLVPVRVDGDLFDLGLTGAGLRGLFRATVPLRRPWSFEAAAGAGVDLLHDRARASEQGAEAGPARTRVVPDATLRLGARVRPGPGPDRLLLRLEATLDLALHSFRYVTGEGATIFDPWVARPGLRLTLGWARGP